MCEAGKVGRVKDESNRGKVFRWVSNASAKAEINGFFRSGLSASAQESRAKIAQILREEEA